MTDMILTVPPAMEDYLRERVAAGDFVDPAEYVRDLIRADAIRQRLGNDDAIRAALEHGEASGRSPRSVKDIVAAERLANAA